MALLAVRLSPILWNRAARVTQKKIESSVPLSLSEIQADKDQMRAKFAIETRRLELDIERLKTKSTENLTKINQQKSIIETFELDLQEKKSQIKELEQRDTKNKNIARKKTEEITELGSQIRAKQAKMNAKNERIHELEKKLSNSSTQVNSLRIELAGGQTRNETLENKIQSITQAKQAVNDKNQQLQDNLSQLETQLSDFKKAYKKEQLHSEKIAKNFTNIEKRLQQREREIENLNDVALKKTDEITELKSQIRAHQSQIKANEKNIHELEKQLSDASTQMDTLRIEFASSQTGNQTLRDKIQLIEQAKQAENEKNVKLQENIRQLEIQISDLEKAYKKENLRAEKIAKNSTHIEQKLQQREREIENLKQDVLAQNNIIVKATEKDNKQTVNSMSEYAFEKKQKNMNKSTTNKMDKRKDSKANSNLPLENPFQYQKTQLQQRLAKLQESISDQVAKLNGAPLKNPSLLEEVNQISAEILSVTAELEGKKSQIWTTLKKDPKPQLEFNNRQQLNKLKAQKSSQAESFISLSNRIAAIHRADVAE